MKKYRFRKMYFLCEDKRVIKPNIAMTNAYQAKEYAESVLRDRLLRRTSGPLSAEHNRHQPMLSVEEFYLVPAKLFDEILKPYVED